MTEQCSLRKAGAEGLRFNSPLSEARASHLIDLVTDDGPTSLIDLGCGKGALLLWAVQSHSGLHGTGIDSDAAMIARAGQEARRLSLQGRAAFITGDAVQWAAPQSQAGICVGASHIFGGIEPTLIRLGELVPHGRVLVADGFWAADPDAWCLETFGSLPVGLDGFSALATNAGWRVVDARASTQQEWDDFEAGWRSGVEAVGTDEARSYASSRRQEYEQHYRSILSFSWLVLAQ
jgi:SAM-dependent methyltransferase